MPPRQPRTRREELFRHLGRTTFDLLVIGGGINGCGIARDAAMRGLSVALVEKGDFGSGTSGRTSRMIHGGLRYLEHGHLRLVMEASRERRILLRTAPHLVRAMEFVWPVYADARVSRAKLAAGLTLYDAFSRFRNPRRPELLSAKAVRRREPAISGDALRGGAVYMDAVTDDARLTLANAIAAEDAGAAILNYAEAELGDTLRRSPRVRDTLTEADVKVSARTIVLALGPWNPAVRGTKGSHILVLRSRTGQERAITFLSAEDQRVLFMVPDGEMSMIGTTDLVTAESPDTVRASQLEVDYLLRSASAVLGTEPLKRKDVVTSWAGIRPLATQSWIESPARLSREHAIDESDGVITVTGGKLTTYRAVAAEVVDRVAHRLKHAQVRAQTDRTPLPGADRHASIVDAIAEDPQLSSRIAAETAYRKAELVVAVRNERAETLGDLLIRRTKVAFRLPDRGLTVAPAVAEIVGPLLGWDQSRRSLEIERFAREVDAMFSIDAPR